MNANTNAAARIAVTTVSSPKGDIEVHRPGCADLKKKNYRNQDAFTWTVGSVVELSHEFWEDQIGDTCDPDSAEGWATAASWAGEFRFMPCAPKLPAEAAEVAPLAVVTLDGQDAEIQVAATPTAPHAFSAKGSAKASACVTCGRTWAASAHRAFRAAASA